MSYVKLFYSSKKKFLYFYFLMSIKPHRGLLQTGFDKFLIHLYEKILNIRLSDDVTEMNLWTSRERRNKSCYEMRSCTIGASSYTFCRCNRSHA